MSGRLITRATREKKKIENDGRLMKKPPGGNQSLWLREISVFPLTVLIMNIRYDIHKNAYTLFIKVCNGHFKFLYLRKEVTLLFPQAPYF